MMTESTGISDPRQGYMNRSTEDELQVTNTVNGQGKTVGIDARTGLSARIFFIQQSEWPWPWPWVQYPRNTSVRVMSSPGDQPHHVI